MTTETPARVTPPDLILATRLMLAGPDGTGRRWRKDHYATADWGCVVPPTDQSACRWCGVGAFAAICGADEPYKVNETGKNALACLKSAVIEITGWRHDEYDIPYAFLVAYNDRFDTTWADMDALFRRAEEIALGITWPAEEVEHE